MRMPLSVRPSFMPQIDWIRLTFRIMTRLSPDAASRLAVRLFRTPRRHDTPPREIALMQGATPFSVRLDDGTDIAAWSWGEGRPVILAHGWEGRGSQMATFAGPLVDAGFRVVTFDGPAHGSSSGRLSSLPQFAAALDAVARTSGTPVAIIGHSLGAAAAVLTVKEGLAVENLILISPPLDPSDYTWHFGEMVGTNRDVIARMRRLIEQEFGRSWSDYSLEAMAPQMTTRLLVIHDHDDRETLWSGAARLVELWPGARLLSTDGLGHRRILRDRDVIAAAVDFLGHA